MNKIMRGAILTAVAAGITFGAVTAVSAEPVGDQLRGNAACESIAAQYTRFGEGQPGLAPKQPAEEPASTVVHGGYAYGCDYVGSGMYRLTKTWAS
ncbi:MAG: hypothetical protein EOP32_01040 [Rhodococcus sp. (in: high G+C Gram-positive bacteria)]|jgi:hypothetical protein|nr:MAG: hypothetical protein EOP32_01040 [Rhodococcus sp. (in: high G+C Gram-positive bacteria)]